MHDTALELGRLFFDRYLPKENASPRILDIGSVDLNGSLRAALPEGRTVNYTGVDLEAGPGVDRVVKSTASLPFDQNWFDIVVSTSCFEHDEAFWMTFDEAVRVLAPGGYLYVSSPSNGHFHQHPLDCWRFYPDAGLALARWANRGPAEAPPRIELVESFVYDRQGAEWNDTVMIFGKPPLREPLPEPLSRLPGARNIRRRGSEGVGQIEFFTEDQRMLAAMGMSAHHLMSALRADTTRALAEGEPLITVLVGYYQGEHTDEAFERCHASIQREDVSSELLIIHDGPLLRDVPDNRVIVETPEHFGNYGHEARAWGLQFARGVYVLHIDADFEFYPGALAELAAQLRAEPVGMLIAQADVKGARLTGHPPSPDSVTLGQVALRRGLAFSYGFPTREPHAAAQLFQAIADEHGYCRSPIVLGKR